MKYKDLGEEVGALVDEKNAAYGNSFHVSEDFIKLLWPNGVPPESYRDMLCVVRIFDKLKRIATNKDWNGESPYRDIAGYALLGVMKDKEQTLPAVLPEKLTKEEEDIWNDLVFNHKCSNEYADHMQEVCTCGHSRVVHECITFYPDMKLNNKYNCTKCSCIRFNEVKEEKKKPRKTKK